MKKIFQLIFLASAVILLGASCKKQAAVDPLQGWYDGAIEVALTSLDGYTMTSGKPNLFTFTFSSSDVTLVAALSCNGDALKANTYTESSVAKNGTYLLGSTYIVVGGSVKQVSSGSIIVTDNGDGTYSVDALLFCEDGSVYKLSWSGEMDFSQGDGSVELTTVMSAASNLGNGVNSVTMNLSTGLTSSFDYTTYTTSYSDDGNFLALDLYSADGFLHEGTYTPCSVGGTIGEGEFGIGYDTEMWGMTFENWGTCWWTVSGGAATAEKILSGTVTVQRISTGWSIRLESDVVVAYYEGPIEALTDGGSTPTTEYVELSSVLSTQNNFTTYGTNSITMQLATDGVTSSYDASTWTTTYTGPGNYLALDIYTSDGTLAAGTYKACETGGTIGEGEFGIGYDTEMWGMTMENWGTCWWTVAEDGSTSAEKVLDGTVTVSLSGSTYTITIESSVVNAKFEGEITL